jgi:hypothetical protein
MCFRCLLNFLTHPYPSHDATQLLLSRAVCCSLFNGIKSWIKLKALKSWLLSMFRRFCAKKFIMFLYHMVITLYRSPFTPENTTTSPIHSAHKVCVLKIKISCCCFTTLLWVKSGEGWLENWTSDDDVKKGLKSWVEEGTHSYIFGVRESRERGF